MIDRFASAQRADVPPFHVMDLIALAEERRRTHGDLVSLLAGQPSTPAPAAVNAEAVRLLGSAAEEISEALIRLDGGMLTRQA